ncbi:MAG: HD domain-containing protein [Myxococcota bacterium]
MTPGRLRLPADSPVPDLARRIEAAGGRIVVVGGFVRDGLRGTPSHDLDLEVFGLPEAAIDPLLEGFGFSPRVGRQLPIWRRSRDGLDLAYPRSGADAYHPERPDSLGPAFRAAARHRDLRINAIGWDPLSDALIDPFDGQADLAARRLRAVDATTFAADPLRLLRVVRLAAVLDAEPDPELCAICRGLAFESVAPERVGGELRRMLLDPSRPARAFEWLAALGRLDVLPPIERLVAVAQDPVWHPEGDVFVHTLMVLDRAHAIAEALDPGEGEILMLAALCHDLGKPETTTAEEGGRIRSIAHEAASARHTRDWLSRLRFPERRVQIVAALVAEHLAPSQLVAQRSGARAYRRLARRLAAGGATLVQLERLARADHLGRSTPEALAGHFDAGPIFLAAAEAAGVALGPRPEVVTAADLIDRGIQPGPELGRLLRRCREIEDESGSSDREVILARCLRGR